jgi:hypothetical protein
MDATKVPYADLCDGLSLGAHARCSRLTGHAYVNPDIDCRSLGGTEWGFLPCQEQGCHRGRYHRGDHGSAQGIHTRKDFIYLTRYGPGRAEAGEVRGTTGEPVRAVTDDGIVYDVQDITKDENGVTWLHLSEHTVTAGPLEPS